MSRKQILIVLTLVVTVLVGISFAQVTATVLKGMGITVDGNLTEAVWGVAKNPLKHDEGMQLTDGSVESHADASGEFVLLWDDEGLYCGSWTKDDVHNTPWSSQPGMATSAWKDDGHEWWVCFDFNDVWEDASPPYYGQFGWQIMKGWVWENGGASDLYVGHISESGPTSTTTDDLKEQGFQAPYTSSDGLSFTTEAQFKWSSFLLGSMSTPSAGKEIGFNIGICDNDGGDNCEGWIRWAEGCHVQYQGWGKVTLSDEAASIRPVRLAPMQQVAKAGAVYDILGRRIHTAGRMIPAGNVNFVRTGSSTKKAIILR